MARSDEKIKKLASLLKKDDPALAAEAVQMLREEAPFEGVVELLASYYDGNHGVVVNKAIESFMNDIKDKSLRAEIISEIKKDHQPKTTTMLVSSCWQSGLDYSSFVIDFAEVFLRSEYGIALECFTVIEESVPFLTGSEKQRVIEIISKKAEYETSARKALAMDLISSLRS